MQSQIYISQGDTGNGDKHVGEADILDLSTEKLNEGTCGSQEELVEGSLNQVLLKFPEMPEKQAVHTVTEQPQAVEENEFPYIPAVQVHESVDQYADHAKVDRVQGNNVEQAHDKVRSILQARLHRDTDQFEVKAQRFHLQPPCTTRRW